MKIIETDLSYLSSTFFLEEWVGNFVQSKEGDISFVSPPNEDEDCKILNVFPILAKQIKILIKERDHLQKKLDRRPVLTDEVLMTIYKDKKADEIIQLIKEGIC